MQVRYLAALLYILLVSCGARSEAEDPQSGARPAGQAAAASPEQALENLRAHIKRLEQQPEHSDPRVVVQHILIGYAGSVPGKRITRTKAEAEQKTAELWVLVETGDDFDTLVKQHTDDAHPGIYAMKSDPRAVQPGEFYRKGMVPAFGNVGWRLNVGEAGVAGYSPADSPYGWHIVKRIE